MSEKETINEKMTKLNKNIEWFYGDDFSLDEATSKFKDSISLVNEIESDLNNLKNEIEVLAEDFS